MEIEKKFREIMSVSGAPLCGFLRFERVRPYLIDCRAKERIDFDAGSVIMAVFPYKIDEDADSNLARYARVRDYHAVVGEILSRACEKLKSEFAGHEFVRFVDNSPIPEVSAAAFCGLGIRGKNGLLINERYGSWVFIGEIVTTLELKETGSEIRECEDCGACAAACPASCIGGEKRNRCVSSILQKKGELSRDETELVKRGGYVFGCDICQQVCPHNRDVPQTYIKEFLESGLFFVDEDNIGDCRDRAFSWRGEGVARRNLGIISGLSDNNMEEK